MKKAFLFFVFFLCVPAVHAYTLPIECPVPFTQSDRDDLYTKVKTNDAQIQQSKTDTANIITSLQNGTFVFQGDDKKQLDALSAQWDAKIAAQQTANYSYSNYENLASEREGLNINDPAEYDAENEKTAAIGQQRTAEIQNEKDTALATLTEQLTETKITELQNTLDTYVAGSDPLMQTMIDTLNCPLTDIIVTPTIATATPITHVVTRTSTITTPVTTSTPAMIITVTPVTKTNVWVRIGNFFKILKFW